MLCVVWVGFDDNRELNLEGSKSALPVWTEFMKRAIQLRPVKRKFDPPPPGVVAVRVDPYSGLLAGPYCGDGQQEYFIAGTQPRAQCESAYDPYSSDLREVMMTGSADRRAADPRPTVISHPPSIMRPQP